MSLTLYLAPKTVGVATQIVLEEVGAEYTLHPLDFSRDEQRGSEYLAVNPKARVPALGTEDGVLTETPAILFYLAQRYPAAGLIPSDEPFLLARLLEFNTYLCATVHTAHAHRVRGNRWTDDPAALESLRTKVPVNMRACFDLIQTHYFQGPWVFGERYSISDAYLFTISNWLAGDSVDIEEFPAIADFNRRMRTRAAVQRVMAWHGL